MHTYTAHILWNRGEQPFLDNRYSRRHVITFDGGAVVPGSSSPQVVRAPLSDPSAVDPEEAFVSSLASCHMLWFLNIAAARRFRVDTYSDQAEGVMENNAKGKLAMSVVTLRPEVVFSGERLPTQEEFVAMHHEAHDECFIANSVLTEVRCEPVLKTVP
ncbi:MAG TPA: OsmC family protein [Blastocatellia bacterium]|nr:OsmC family protein [Blastocatellia bacterium]